MKQEGDLEIWKGGLEEATYIMPEKKNGRKNADSDQDLKSEVAALASQLGLAASTRDDAGFDDTDFRPPTKGGGVKQSAQANIPSQRAARETTPRAAKVGLDAIGRPTHGAQDTAGDAQKKATGRTWKSGVGPRPGDERS